MRERGLQYRREAGFCCRITAQSALRSQQPSAPRAQRVPEPGQDRRQRVQQRNECRACSCRPRRQQEQGPARRCAESDRERERDSRPSWSVQRPLRGGERRTLDGERTIGAATNSGPASRMQASMVCGSQPGEATATAIDRIAPHRLRIAASPVRPSRPRPPSRPRLASPSSPPNGRPVAPFTHARTHARTKIAWRAGRTAGLPGWPGLAWPGLAWPAVGQAVSCARLAQMFDCDSGQPAKIEPQRASSFPPAQN